MSNTYLTKQFWIAAGERALKTAAQAGVTTFGGVVFTDIDEVMPAVALIGLAALSGGLLSALTSIASANIGNYGPSLANEALTDVKDDVVDDFDPESTDEHDPIL